MEKDGRRERREAKAEVVLNLLAKKEGATIEELQAAIGCCKRTVYALLRFLEGAQKGVIVRQGGRANGRFFLL